MYAVLVVEDNLTIAQQIERSLTQEDYACRRVSDGWAALEAVPKFQPDVIILDWMLTGIDGLEVCTRLRRNPGTKDPYILMLSAKGETLDRVVALSTGADDYLVKPYESVELVAKVRALLRRNLRHERESLVYRTQHFVVDVTQRTASRQIKSSPLQKLDLTHSEFDLLSTLVSQPYRVWSRTQLIEKVWGYDFYGEERVVDTQIARLRKKIEPDPANPTFIKTVIGVGYRFEDAVEK